MTSPPHAAHLSPPAGGHDPAGAVPPEPDPGDLAIRVRGVGKEFDTGDDTVVALSNVDLDVAQREFVALLGPSGCGKTTLLKILAGLEAPTSGIIDYRIEAAGRPLHSMVFQEHGIFPWMTVLDNVALGLRARGIERRQREEVARQYIRMTGLTRFESSYPHQLSGGMRQRVNVARAFANDPAVLLMDEPFGALDEQTRMILHQDLLRLFDEEHKTVVFITHSLDEAVTLADRVVVMARRPGRCKVSIDVDLPRPRKVLEVQGSPEFASARAAVWAALREEVQSLAHDTEGDPVEDPRPRRRMWPRR